jgi:PPP family 3-phenylpropionic acid transporter
MPADERALRKNILLFSLFFLLFFAGLGLMMPFLSLQFKAIGYNGVQISLLNMLSALAVILTAPQYGLIFDRSKDKRLILLISLAIATVTLFLIPYLRAFGAMLVIYTINRVIISSSITASENLSYQVSADKNGEEQPAFGSLRMWGSLGFALTALLGGMIFQNFGLLRNDRIFLGLMAATCVVLLLMPESIFRERRSSESVEAPLGTHGVIHLIAEDRYLLLTVIALALTDPLFDGVRSFEPIFMAELGLPVSVIGLAATLSALLEVPMMLGADHLIERLGARNLVIAILAFDLTRRLLVWLFPSGWMVFALNIMTAISFTLRLVTTVHLVNVRIPKQYTTTAFTFVFNTMNGIMYILSNAISGVIYDSYGARHIYLVSATLCVIALGCALAARHISSEKELV